MRFGTTARGAHIDGKRETSSARQFQFSLKSHLKRCDFAAVLLVAASCHRHFSDAQLPGSIAKSAGAFSLIDGA